MDTQLNTKLLLCESSRGWNTLEITHRLTFVAARITAAFPLWEKEYARKCAQSQRLFVPDSYNMVNTANDTTISKANTYCELVQQYYEAKFVLNSYTIRVQ